MKQRLDIYLTNKFLDNEGIGKFSRVEIQSFIKTGAVKVNDKIIKKPSFEVNEEHDNVIIDNNIVSIYLKDKASSLILKPKQMDIDIVFENENFIVINKQAGLSVHPGAGNNNNTLVNGLLAMQQQGKITLSNERGNMRLGIVHRLDKDTSGLMIVAKNNLAHRLISSLIKQHLIERKYLALCHGVPVPSSGKITNYICRDVKNIEKMKICNIDDKKAKLAITNYKLIKTFSNNEMLKLVNEYIKNKKTNNDLDVFCNGDFFNYIIGKNSVQINASMEKDDRYYSLIECKLETGRTHQIRLHMQHIKHPLVGEKIYSYSNLQALDEKLGITRQMLYSYSLHFEDPISKKIIDIKI